jgi:hypothetical protein
VPFWNLLERFNVPPRTLTVILSQLMLFGDEFTCGDEQGVKDYELSVRAASIYFFLVSSLVPRDWERHEKVFHVVVYHRALDALKVVLRCVKHESRGKNKKRTNRGGDETEGEFDATANDETVRFFLFSFCFFVFFFKL